MIETAVLPPHPAASHVERPQELRRANGVTLDPDLRPTADVAPEPSADAVGGKLYGEQNDTLEALSNRTPTFAGRGCSEFANMRCRQ
jgi:hypothetical protein